jgi:WD40 repeat protein
MGSSAWRHWLAGSGAPAGIAFDPEGKAMVVWSHGGWGTEQTLRVWNAATATERARYTRPAHRAGFGVPGYCDGRWAALFSGGMGNWSWQVWDLRGGREPVTLWARGAPLTCLAFSADGRLAASGTSDGRVWLWDATTGEPLGEPVPIHPGSTVQQLAFAAREDLLAAAVVSRDGDREVGKIRFWAPKAGKDRGALDATDVSRFEALTFTADDVTLVAQASRPRTALRTYYVTAGRQRLNRDDWTYLALSPEGVLACAGGGGVIRLCTLDGVDVGQFRGHTGDPTAAAFSRDGKQLVSLSAEDGTVRLWDVKAGQQVNPVDRGVGPVRFVAASPDGRRVAAVRGGGVLQLWEAPSGAARGMIQTPEGQEFLAAAFAPGGKLLAASTTAGEVWVWDVPAHELLVTLRGAETGVPVGSVAFSRDGKTLACGNAEEGARCWEVSAGRDGWKPHGPALNLLGRKLSGVVHLSHRGGPAEASPSVALSPFVHSLVTLGGGAVRLWDRDTGVELFAQVPGRGDLRALTLSPDGTRLACGTDTGALLVWQFAGAGTLEELTTQGAVGPVVGVAFGSHGGELFTASSDGEIARWIFVNAERAFRKQGHALLQGPVHGLARYPDGDHALTANGDGTVYLLNLDSVREAKP